ncbi:MAG: hypothetical protein AB8B56_16815 [Crocinitomicaceae bacterium]
MTSSSVFGQIGNQEKPNYISIDEARTIAKQRDGYRLTSTVLDSNEWCVMYSKYVGYTEGNMPVSKNILTRIDAETGKIKKVRRLNSLQMKAPGIDRSPQMTFKRKKRMKVWGEWKIVYYN